jgi:hypothetical protein
MFTVVMVTFSAAPAAASSSSGGIDGGGFQNVVAVDPHGSGIVISGADVSGFQVGSGNGTRFSPRNQAATQSGDLSVATIKFATRSNAIYAGTGSGNSGSDFWTSLDGGQTWTKTGEGSPQPNFSGINLDHFNFRSTGNLLALDESQSPPIIYAASYDEGVMRSSDGGNTWTVIGLAGKYLRGIAIDPNNPAIVYVASYDDGVYVSTDANGDCTSSCELFGSTAMSGSPLYPEELLTLGTSTSPTVLYAAAAANTDTGTLGGIYKYSAGTWSLIDGDAGTLSRNSVWFAIDGYISADGRRHLVVGCHDVCQADTGSWGTLYEDVYRSDDEGHTWTSLILPPSVIQSNQEGGPGGPQWWEALPSGFPQYMLGQSGFGVSQIAVDPSDRQRYFVSGNSGVWRTDNAGLTWYPCVSGMMVTQAQSVAVDPNQPGRVYTAVFDWRLLYSTDHGATSVRSLPPGAGDWGTSVAVDPVNSRVYLATGEPDPTTSGDLFSADAATMTWKSEGLGAADGGKRADGIAVDEVSGQPVVVASVVGSGIWREQAGSWGTKPVLANASFGGGVPTVSWIHGSNLVYVYDRNSGLWLSKDYGKTWGTQPIWAVKTIAPLSGYIAADPTDPSRVYASVDTGLFRIDDADGVPVVTAISLPSPGAVTVDQSGAVWVAGVQNTLATGKLYRSTDQGGTWPSFDDDYYRNIAGWPSEIAVGSDGYQYVASLYNAMVVGAPVNAQGIPSVTGVSPASGSIAGGTSVTIAGTNFTGATEVNFGRVAAAGFTVVGSTKIVATSPPGLALGPADIGVTTANATSAPTAADLFTYAVTPTVTGVAPSSGSTGGGTAVLITGSTLLGATDVKFGTVSATSFTVVSDWKISAVTPPRVAGTVDVTVTGPGGTSLTSPTDQYTYAVTPAVTGVSPPSGTTLGGTVVTITGSGFTGATVVKFGNVALPTFTVVSSSKITATTLPFRPRTLDVTVTGPGGTSPITAADQYTYALTPTVSAVIPISGSKLGGTSVVITGKGFTGATAVRFGAVSATSFTVVSDWKISVVTPAHSVGTVDITVTGPGGTSLTSLTDRFTYV